MTFTNTINCQILPLFDESQYHGQDLFLFVAIRRKVASLAGGKQEYHAYLVSVQPFGKESTRRVKSRCELTGEDVSNKSIGCELFSFFGKYSLEPILAVRSASILLLQKIDEE